jgi:hypothetical protein
VRVSDWETKRGGIEREREEGGLDRRKKSKV